MNRSKIDEIVEAVLYEGYILYPYRPSSTKNRQRFTFGRVYPEAYSEVEDGEERCVMQTQCLVEASSDGATPELTVEVPFLHPMARVVGRLPEPLTELPDEGEPEFKVVPSLQTDGEIYQTWEEAVEREVRLDPVLLPVVSETTYDVDFSFPASRTLEPIHDAQDRIVGVQRRNQYALDGTVMVAAEPVEDGVFRVTVRILNRTLVPSDDLDDQDEVIMRTLASTQTVLGVEGGTFVSMMDPPARYADAADACKNEGTWPVLVGDEEEDQQDTMLSSPIILYDYPEIASESAGDLFDSTEIDELLTLRIMTLTDEEKREMRQADDRAREILERTENLPREHLQKMHGTLREMGLTDEEDGPMGGREDQSRRPYDTSEQLDSVSADGHRYEPGDRVRLQPGERRADAMDLVLDGKTAEIEAVEEDYEGRIHLAVVLEADPGRELGMMRQPGHRFFFSPDEVEPVEESQ